MEKTIAEPSASESERITDLLRFLPGGGTILEIGCRHGMITRLLAERFETVTALDLQQPTFQIPHVVNAKGDVQRLEFPDNSFDHVLCSEVLEHVPDVAAAAREITRVTRHSAIIGVPYRQDTRVGQSRCRHCNRITPPYGHINRFDENILKTLFSDLALADIHYVGSNRERTNSLAVWLDDLSGNPYGSYDQEEGCIHCGQKLTPPASISAAQRLCAAVATRIYLLQKAFNRPQATWMHALFFKSSRQA